MTFLLKSPIFNIMKSINTLTSACRYCRHYQPEGRRGGICQQLSAPVQACWKACSLAVPAFAPAWESLEDAWSLPVAQPIVAISDHLNSDADNFVTSSVEEHISPVLAEVKTKVAVV
jgi:hypothetical protein